MRARTQLNAAVWLWLLLGVLVGCAHGGGRHGVGPKYGGGTDILFTEDSVPFAAPGPYTTGPAGFVGTDRLAFTSGSWLLLSDLEAPSEITESYDLKFDIQEMEVRGSRILAWSSVGQVAVVDLESRTIEMRMTLARPPSGRLELRWNPSGTLFTYIDKDHQLVARATAHRVSYAGPAGTVLAENVVDHLFIDVGRLAYIQAEGDRFSSHRHLLVHDFRVARNPVVQWEAKYHPRRLYSIGRDGYIGALAGYILIRINLSDNNYDSLTEEELLDPFELEYSHIAFSPDGSTLLVPDPDAGASLLILDAESGAPRGTMALDDVLVHPPLGSTTVHVHPKGDLVLVESHERLELLSIRERAQVSSISRRWDRPEVFAHKDGFSVFVATGDQLYRCTPGSSPESVLPSEHIIGNELLFSPGHDVAASYSRRGGVLGVFSVHDDTASVRLSFRSEYRHGGDYLHAWWEDDSTLRVMGQRSGVIELVEWRPEYDDPRVLATAEFPRNVEVVMGDGVVAHGRHGSLFITGADTEFGEWRQVGMPFQGRLVGFSGRSRLWVLAPTGHPHIFDSATNRWQAIDLPMPYPIGHVYTYTYTNRVLIQDIRDIVWLYEELGDGRYRIRQVSPHPFNRPHLAPGPEDRAAIAGLCPHTGRVRLVRVDTGD
jgi:hypothetical protein